MVKKLTLSTPIPISGGIHMTRYTHWAVNILPKDNTTQIFSDLRIRWYLVELVHIHDNIHFLLICANIF